MISVGMVDWALDCGGESDGVGGTSMIPMEEEGDSSSLLSAVSLLGARILALLGVNLRGL